MFKNLSSPRHLEVVAFSIKIPSSSSSKYSKTIDKKAIPVFLFIWTFEEINWITTSFSSRTHTDTTTEHIFWIVASLGHWFLICRWSPRIRLVDEEQDKSLSFFLLNASTSVCSLGKYFSAHDTVPGMLTFFCCTWQVYFHYDRKYLKILGTSY